MSLAKHSGSEFENNNGGQAMGDLSIDILKQMATEQSFLKGKDYYAGGVVEERVFDNGILIGEVEGSSGDYYDVRLEINKPFGNHCTCPYDWEGICKHIVALGLAWLYNPETFMEKKELEQPQKEEIDEIINIMDKEDLAFFLSTLINEDNTIRLKFLSFMEKYSTIPTALTEEKIKALMDQALPIIEEFNTFGGGLEEEEDECCEWLQEMIDILQEEDSISPQLRQEIINSFMEEYINRNSGFEDLIWDTIIAAVRSKEDWELIIKGLQKTESDYDQERIMEIYLNKLGNEQKYLEMRKKKLEYGNDYFDLVEYYHKKGEQEKAASIAREGERKGKGRIIDNIRYLENYYQQIGDQSKVLEYAIKEFKEEPSLEKYIFIIENGDTSEEKENFKRELKSFLLEESFYGRGSLLADIYYHEGEFDKILELVLKREVRPNPYYKKLVKLFPEEMLTYYKEDVKRLLKNKNRKSYSQAAGVALMIKEIYSQLNDLEGWRKYFNGILEAYPRHKALQEEFQRLN